MERFRKMLSTASLTAARTWEFIPPTQGNEADEEYWLVRVPLDFIAPGDQPLNENEWNPYIPGPRATIPWVINNRGLAPDALAAGGVYPARQDGIQLKTAIE